MIAIFAGSTIAALVFASAVPFRSDIEQPAYTVERSDGPIELRAYPPLLVAAAAVESTRGPAVSKGFRTLADYIFGVISIFFPSAVAAPVMQEETSAP